MIRIDINAEAALAGLRRLAAGLDDLTPVMQELGEYLVESTKERFVAGQAPDGTPWAPKSRTTIEAYLGRGDRADPRPLFGPSGSLSSQIFSEARPDAVEVGSNLIYAAVMQFGAGQGAFGRTARGGPIPWGDIPARPFLGLSEENGTNILAIVEEWLAGLDPSAAD